MKRETRSCWAWLVTLWLCAPVLAAQQADSASCRGPAGYEAREIRGSVLAGELFQAGFGDRFMLVLDPVESGWRVQVREAGREDDLAGLTPPWHFVPNPRSVEGWHFRNADNTGPNDGSVNAPGREREFIFSPEVGRSLQYLGSATPDTVVERVAEFGRGVLTVVDYDLTPPARGERAAFRRLRFVACLRWRTSPAGPGDGPAGEWRLDSLAVDPLTPDLADSTRPVGEVRIGNRRLVRAGGG